MRHLKTIQNKQNIFQVEVMEFTSGTRFLINGDQFAETSVKIQYRNDHY